MAIEKKSIFAFSKFRLIKFGIVCHFLIFALLLYSGCSGNKYIIYNVGEKRKTIAKAYKNRTIFYLKNGSSVTGYLYSVKNDSIYFSSKYFVYEDENPPINALAIKDINHIKIIGKPIIPDWALLLLGGIGLILLIGALSFSGLNYD